MNWGWILGDFLGFLMPPPWCFTKGIELNGLSVLVLGSKKKKSLVDIAGCKEVLLWLLTMLPRYFSYIRIVHMRSNSLCKTCFDFIASSIILAIMFKHDYEILFPFLRIFVVVKLTLIASWYICNCSQQAFNTSYRGVLLNQTWNGNLKRR